MTDPNPKDRRLLKADVSFAVVAVASIIMVVAESFNRIEAVAIPDNPALLAALSIAFMLLLGLLSARFARIDRQCSEEYTIRIVGHAAIVAVMTGLLFHLLFGQDFLLGGVFGRMSADRLLGVILGAWAFGYFTYRIRGTAA